MKPLTNHSRCCKSALDRCRHELDRGMRARAHEMAKPKPREQKMRGINRHIAKWTRYCQALEGAALKSQYVVDVRAVNETPPS